MKIAKSTLKRIIAEEYSRLVSEVQSGDLNDTYYLGTRLDQRKGLGQYPGDLVEVSAEKIYKVGLSSIKDNQELDNQTVKGEIINLGVHNDDYSKHYVPAEVMSKPVLKLQKDNIFYVIPIGSNNIKSIIRISFEKNKEGKLERKEVSL